MSGHMMCTDAFEGFAAKPLDRPLVRECAASVTETPQTCENAKNQRRVAEARAAVGGSGLNGFDRAWKQRTSQLDSLCTKTRSAVGNAPSHGRGFATEKTREEWERLRRRGEKINPCNSPAHPAAIAGVEGVVNPTQPKKSIQQSYDAHSQCFVCGNARVDTDGVGLRSFRSEDSDEIEQMRSALRSEAVVGDTYQGLPGIVSTGIMDALMICHGSWQSAIALMDRAITPRPPLVLTKTFSVTVRDRLPPGFKVSVVTKSIDVKDVKEPHSVKVVMELRARGPDDVPFVCATGEALYEKVGAVRSMW
jgi:hypothetical protein